MTMDQLVESYLQLREKLKQINEKEKKVRALMDTLEGVMLSQMQASGAESVRTAHGTAYVSVRRSAKVRSWPDFIQYVFKTGNDSLLERRVSSKAALEMLEETGQLPPGLDIYAATTVNVRSA